MADNTKQFVWITVLFGNLAALFRDRQDVFVCGNQFWYPVEGHPEVVNAPDVYVVFGRPKGHRRSWKQWEEGGVPMTVVFEVLSPKNTAREMEEKRLFYEHYGVEEYYLYDPDTNTLKVWLRKGSAFARVRKFKSFVSPRLGVRFDLAGPEMVVYYPDGKPFLPFEELKSEHDRAVRLADRAVRLAELSRKARHQQATPEELRELDALEDEMLPP
jgi:Uma2 family endonuclease